MKESKRHASEIKFFLLLIPLINAFNYYLTYNNISLNWRTLFTFSIDTLEGYAAWAAVHFIIRYLDQRMPFQENVFKRLIVQITTTVFTGMFIIIGLTVIMHYALRDDPMPVSFFSYDIFIISVWFLVINGIYIAVHFYSEWRISEGKRVEENKIKMGGLTVKAGKKELFLNYGDIAGFNVDGDYIICYTTDGKKFLLDQSMDKLEKSLPISSFFRLNRQTLIHRQTVSGFQKDVNGKLNILVKSLSPISFPLNVSRTRASAFKAWFQSE
jgi:hypothetical protein